MSDGPITEQASDDGDDLEAFLDELEAEERETERLSRQASLYEQAPKRGDRV